MLMKANGEFVQGGLCGHYSFAGTLLIKEGTFAAGDYILYIMPIWSGTTDHPDFKKVLADVYSPTQVQMEEIDSKTGIDCLVATLKR